MEDISGYYDAVGASRTTGDDNMAALVASIMQSRRQQLKHLHPDRNGGRSTEEFQDFESKWNEQYKEAVDTLGSREER